MNKLLFINKPIEEVFYLKSFQILNKFKCNKKQELISIIIILDNNPNHFRSVYQSIIKQMYHNFAIYLLYNNDTCISYALEHLNDNYVNKLIFCNNYKYFIENFNQGNYIVIKDNQKFINKNVLKYINNNLSNNNLKWHHFSNDRIIYDTNIKCGNLKNKNIIELPIILTCDNNSKI